MNGLTLQHVAQIGLAIACVALAIYCAVLARRLRRLNDLESGLGGAIAVMTSEVSRLEAALAQTRREAAGAGAQLAAAVENARNERALWAIQTRMAPVSAPGAGVRMRRRRRSDSDDAPSGAEVSDVA
ncbi:hypothetical protein DRW48_04420 [Paracoccus suum]|uniref:Uncharacterized protein n=1 Tax=Paracoccus suum TaxID=2259340 RepID=A0A344PI29_9RHOB|nr:hypothetical protein [Paracoccus suum]AXC49034.1 hypothetical protein DRW48_04420 [Paracoccus suum]